MPCFSNSTEIVLQDGIAFIALLASRTTESMCERPTTDCAPIPCTEPVLGVDATCSGSVYLQEGTDDSVLEDPASEQKKSNKRSRDRPCKGKRLRYQKLVARLQSELLACPETFNMEEVMLPPNILQNERKLLGLINRMDQFRHRLCKGGEANVAGSYEQQT